MDLIWQPTMFGERSFGDQVGEDPPGLRRVWLDERSWIDTCAGWFGDHERLLEDFVRDAPWSQRERRMYDRDVLEPRLVAAWHGDTVRRRLPEAVVVTVALGERRRFLLRKGTDGPPTHTLRTGEGDLLVMGGRCQNEWQHTVPKESRAGTRMSITMRHSALLARP